MNACQDLSTVQVEYIQAGGILEEAQSNLVRDSLVSKRYMWLWISLAKVGLPEACFGMTKKCILCILDSSTRIIPRRQWHPTPVLLLGKSFGWRMQSMGSLRVRHDWATSLSLFTFMHWRRKWQPTPKFLLGESQGRGSLVGCCLWGHTESDMTEVT